jgi:hypothetical protein
MAGATRIFTYQLSNGSLSIDASMNVQKLSILTKQGTATFLGSAQFQGLTSQAINFSVGQGITVSASSTATCLDGVIVTAGTVGDIIDLVISYQ